LLQPTKERIINELEKVLKEEATREEVVDWAMHFIECDDLEIVDFVAWDLLKVVGGLDMIVSPDVYLYSFEDIRKWVSDYQNRC
jgi:hypothetical protein